MKLLDEIPWWIWATLALIFLVLAVDTAIKAVGS